MGFLDKVKNAAERMKGKTKEEVGERTDDPDKAAEGRADQSKSDLKDAGEKLKDAGGDVKDSFKR